MCPKTILLFVLVIFVGCGGTDSNSRIAFRVSLSQLPAVGDSQVFEGWAVVEGIPASTGRFVVDASAVPARVTSPDGIRNYGTVAEATFGPASTGLGRDFPRILEASHFFITIESAVGTSLRPSARVLLAGVIVGDRADLSPFGETGQSAATALPDWRSAVATAMLTSPTGGGSPENGVWFSSDPNPPGMSSLGLQALALDGFRYEAWVRDPVLSTWWSLGTFRDPASFDRDAQVAPTRGTDSIGLLTPGQDFVRAATFGGSMPLDLTSGNFEAFVTLEPEADNALEPFPLVLLSAPIPTDAVGSTGRADRNVMMVTAPADLPLLTVQGSTSEITFAGRAPPSLGGATAGQYVIYLRANASTFTPIRFTVTSTGDVRSFGTGVLLGTQANFVVNPANTGLGLTFPDILLADEILIALEPQGVMFSEPVTPVLLSGFLLEGSGVATMDSIADFLSISGSFVTMSPTNDAPGVPFDDGSGLWFRDLLTGAPSLALPTLPPSFSYEGWVRNTITGEVASTGKFRDVGSADEDAATFVGRGTGFGFSVPGQDFLNTVAPQSIPAWLDLRGTEIQISLEPFPDDAVTPYLPILIGTLPSVTQTSSAPLVTIPTLIPGGVLTFDR